MDTELNSPPRDGAPAFKKPSNDGSGRKYRRRALADDGSSSSDGSSERDQISRHSKEDVRKVSEAVHERRDDRQESDDRSRYGRGGIDSRRHERHSRDDHHYRSKRDEYNRHERDGARSSRDSRSDYRRAETEHGRSRKDSDRHSRDKEKDYVKRGSRWTSGDRHSRDEKELEDREINKEKDGHAKSPRDRPDGATENRDTHSKKLKGFVSEKFTHGNTNEQKHTSRFKPASLGSGNQGLSSQSHSKEAEVSGDVDAAKVAAMQAAELVNKNLVGTGYLTTDQKKKLLWGKKKSTASEEPAHRWDSALVGDRERQEKFNKLMSLRLRWCIIVGCEGECSKPRAEPKRSPSREAERVAEGSREAVHSRIKEERRAYGWVRSLNLFDKLSSYSCLLLYLRTLVASPFCNLLLLLHMSKPLITVNSMCVTITFSKPCLRLLEFEFDFRVWFCLLDEFSGLIFSIDESLF